MLIQQPNEGNVKEHNRSRELVYGFKSNDVMPDYINCEIHQHYETKQDRKFSKIGGFDSDYNSSNLLPAIFAALLSVTYHAYQKEVSIIVKDGRAAKFFQALLMMKELIYSSSLLSKHLSNKSYHDKLTDDHNNIVTTYGIATDNGTEPSHETAGTAVNEKTILEDTDNGIKCVAACPTETAAAEPLTDDNVQEADVTVAGMGVFENSDILNGSRLSIPVQCTDTEGASISPVSELNCLTESPVHSSGTSFSKHKCVSSSNVDIQSPSCKILDTGIVVDDTASEKHHARGECLEEVDAVSENESVPVPFEVMEFILLKASHSVVKRAWSDKVQHPVQAALTSLSSTCWDWYNVICQPRFSHLLLNHIHLVDPYLLYSNNPSLLSVVHGESDVNGIAVCGDQLYMISISSPMIDIYDAQRFDLEWSLVVPDMEDPWDIAACERNECLYIFEGQCQVLCVDLQGNVRHRWIVGVDPSGLSVTQEGLVLVTFCNRLVKYSAAGDEVQTVNFVDDISYASQAVYLNGSLVVCNGGGRSTVTHMICSVGDDGHIIKRHTDTTGSLYQPVHMSLADHGCILVADINGRRIQILNKNLERINNLIVDRHGNDWPLRICYDHKRGQLFVNMLNGKVVVYRILNQNVGLMNGSLL